MVFVYVLVKCTLRPVQGAMDSIVWGTVRTKMTTSHRSRNFPASAASALLISLAMLSAGTTAFGQIAATPVQRITAAEGFEVELLYSVPKDREGSWVNMCVDPKGRLIVSDQYGGLYRVTPPAIGSDAKIQIEKIDVDMGEAQGLLWAYDSLYVVVNRGRKYASGVYRVRDTDGDDKLDTVETLRKLDGGAEHGPHAVLPAPDGNGLYIVCGDGTRLPKIDTSRVPQIWDEDLLLPRAYGRNFMKGTPAPGGYICRIDKDGKTWELVSVGYRNEFDAAFNADGELFTFDADMEWDMNTPWYRPTRVCHVVSGSEFGWRNGSGKWPPYYPDSLPATVNIGPGSPTGICFGYGAKFPAKYQKALFISDWSYGKLYAVHLEPDGATYSGEFEEFVTGIPLPLTDVVINPHDRAMYFAIGGRRMQSGFYRVTYTGGESTAMADARDRSGAELRGLRHRLEALHLGDHPSAVDIAWPHLAHPDRFIRFAARTALEHRPVEEWQVRALSETDPQTSLTALLALTRKIPRENKGRGEDIDTPLPVYPATEAARHPLQEEVLAALARFDWTQLSVQQRIDLLRVYTLTFVRLGPPDEAAREKLIATFDPVFPSTSRVVNSELAQLLVYLQAPSAPTKTLDLLAAATTQEAQIDYAKSLRHAREGWTDDLQEEYFQWFTKAAGFRGGAAFARFVQNVKEGALAKLSEDDKARLKPILDARPSGISTPIAAEPRSLVKEWKMDELLELVENRLSERNFEHGRRMFAAANCFACHRFDQQGGAVGPDLTALSGRFNNRDLIESLVEPSKVISDQYAAVQIATTDGKVITGRIFNLSQNGYSISTDMLDPKAEVHVKVDVIEEMIPSTVSMMPEGLLNTLNAEEVLDLMAYLLSRGDPKHEMFRSSGGGK